MAILKNPWVKNILLILGVLVVLYVGVSFFLKGVTRHNKELVVPDFSNMSVSDAKKEARKHHLRLEVTDSVYIKRMGRGLISRQNPIPGSKVKKNRRILLTINSVIPKKVEMPNLIGYSLRQAKTELVSAGLSVGKLIYVPDIATNNVLSQQFRGSDIIGGTMIESESLIDLVLGLNVRQSSTFVPDVRGYRFATAKDLIIDNSLNVLKANFDETVLNYSDSVEAVVYRQIPLPSEEAIHSMGAPVQLFLTKDPKKLNTTTNE